MKSTWLRRIIPYIIVLVTFAAAILYLVYVTKQSQNHSLQASGTVESVEVSIAAELGGRVKTVLVTEGQRVSAGDELLQIDDSLYQAQQERAQAGLNLAKANLDAATAARAAAQASLDSAQVNYQMVLNNALSEAVNEHLTAWKQTKPTEFSEPVWYFDKTEEVDAARKEVEASQQALADEENYFEQLSISLNTTEFREAETRLAEAQAAFLVANDLLDLAATQPDDSIRQVAQDQFDAAKADLESAQTQYDRILSEKSAQDVNEARARLAVARQRHQLAQDRLNVLLTGEDSLVVQSAAAAVSQAQANLDQVDANILQAQRAVEQAQAEIDLLDVQIAKLTLYAPLDGRVITSSIEPGEVIQPVASVMIIGQIDNLTITVYIPEDRYGEIFLGQTASVSADSFPGETFHAQVVHIADQAEYTPRNVQTEEGRRTTVFAIKLAVEDPQGKLKPGMPADVVFTE